MIILQLTDKQETLPLTIMRRAENTNARALKQHRFPHPMLHAVLVIASNLAFSAWK